jgi:hypothetical protein
MLKGTPVIDVQSESVSDDPRPPVGFSEIVQWWRGGKRFAMDQTGRKKAIADLARDIDNMPDKIVYVPSIVTQGDTSGGGATLPTRIKILAQTPDGVGVSRSNHRLRVRVHNSGTVTASTNATLAVALGTTLLADLGSAKDLLIEESGGAILTTALSGSNNDLKFVSKRAGTLGNAITVAYVNPATASAALSVAVSGTAITVNLATSAGTAQVETAVVATTANSGPTESATLHVTFTSAAVTGSPVIVPVALLDADANDAAVATKIRAALTANAAIAAEFTIGGSGANVVATAIDPAANDATLNIAWSDAVSGLAEVTSSTNTTAGVAPAITSTAAQVEAAIEAFAAAHALVTITNASGSDGTGVVTAMAATALSGGSDDGDAFYLDLANGTAETVTVETGPSPYGETTIGDFSQQLNVTHA